MTSSLYHLFFPQILHQHVQMSKCLTFPSASRVCSKIFLLYPVIPFTLLHIKSLLIETVRGCSWLVKLPGITASYLIFTHGLYMIYIYKYIYYSYLLWKGQAHFDIKCRRQKYILYTKKYDIVIWVRKHLLVTQWNK